MPVAFLLILAVLLPPPVIGGLPRTLAGATLGETFTPPSGAVQEDDTFKYIDADGHAITVRIRTDKKVILIARNYGDPPAEMFKTLPAQYRKQYKKYISEDSAGAGEFFLSFSDGKTVLNLFGEEGEPRFIRVVLMLPTEEWY